VRFTLMNPDRVTHLVLEDPLGLADYRTGIPAQSEETLYQHELRWTDPATIRGYVKGYFVNPDPKVWEPLADVLVRVTLSPDYPRWARAAALTFQMIYQQPVRYEYHQLAPPVLLVVGAEDHVVPLGQYATAAEAARLGDFVALSAAAPRHAGGGTRLRAHPAPRTSEPVPGRTAAVPRTLTLRAIGCWADRDVLSVGGRPEPVRCRARRGDRRRAHPECSGIVGGCI
jgi:hypothetical protein